jgi:hypothetical protein
MAGYSIGYLANVWRRRGHQVEVPVSLQGLPDADVAILHVNLSLVPPYYAELAAHYPVLLNGKALDIRKRNVSRNLVRQGDSWSGPVIVKSDFNCNGLPELLYQRRAERLGMVPQRRIEAPIAYAILPHPDAVAHAVWTSDLHVVERFLPEQEGDTFFIRTWLFFGDRERCVRCRGHDPVLKGSSIIAYQPAEIPDAIRAERERLGFDFGKFDFVIHDGEPILLDANKTPSLPAPSPRVEPLYAFLAEGLDSFLASPSAARELDGAGLRA